MRKVKRLITVGAVMSAMTGGLMGVGTSVASALPDPNTIVDITLTQGCTLTYVNAEYTVYQSWGPSITVQLPYVITRVPNVFKITEGTSGATVAYIGCI